MNLMFVVDDNYIDQLLVTLHSIFINHDCGMQVYVVTSGLQEKHRQKLETFIEKRGWKLWYHQYQDSCIDTGRMINRNWNPIVYYKLYGIFGIRDIDRILYLDCDVIVDGDLTDFYDTDLEGYYGAVIEDVGMEQVIPDCELHLKRLMIKKGEYFNGGVMLLNLREIQREMSLQQLIDRFERYAGLMPFNEQDLLNMVWNGRLRYMDSRYNRIASDFRYRKQIGKDRDVVIYHYTTNKPWVNWWKTDKDGYGWCVKKYMQYCQLAETRELFLQVKRVNRGLGRRILWRLKGRMAYNPYRLCPDGGASTRLMGMFMVGKLEAKAAKLEKELLCEKQLGSFFHTLAVKGKCGAEAYFRTHQIHTIAVYGTGRVYQAVAEELAESADIRYFIDKRNRGKWLNGKPIVSAEDLGKMEQVDGIVVTAVGFFHEIENGVEEGSLREKLIDMEEMIYFDQAKRPESRDI